MDNLISLLKNCAIQLLLIFQFVLVLSGSSQTTLTIDECYQRANNNYPMVKQLALIEKSKEYSIANASKAYLPQLTFSGQGTYQSEVTEIKAPGLNVTPLSKDQYRITGEVYQTLTDYGTIKQQKELVKANAEVDKQKTETELYKLKDRINQLYFGILLLDLQLEQNELLKLDIKSALDKINAAITNGTAYKSNGAELEAELLKAKQRTTELSAVKKAYSNMLGTFIGQQLNDQTLLQTPAAKVLGGTVNRPELKVYDAQLKTFNIQKNLINNRNIPKLGVFFQGGYGRPGLNLLNNDFRTFYTTGVRLNWNFSGLYTAKKEKKLLDIHKENISVQKETFLFNTHLTLSQQSTEITKYQELINDDKLIIQLREQIKTSAKAQLENGIITTKDFINYINDEDQAKQNLLLHKVQLLLAQYNYQTTSGNQ
jgi:outer membrane protein TolC